MHKRETLIRTRSLTAAAVFVTLLSFSLPNVISTAEAGGKHRLTGAWIVTITPRNCATNDPIPGAAFEGLYTFHDDGTLSAWVQNAFITVTRSPSHGVWERNHGTKDYSIRFVHLRYDASGAYAGRQESVGTLLLNRSGNRFRTDGSTSFFDVDGNPLGGGCSDSVGQRFDL